MTKLKFTGTITLIDGSTVTVADDIENGLTTAQDVRTDILAYKQIHYKDGETEVVIPYHSILKAEFTKETVEVEDPVDESCVEEEE